MGNTISNVASYFAAKPEADLAAQEHRQKDRQARAIKNLKFMPISLYGNLEANDTVLSTLRNAYRPLYKNDSSSTQQSGYIPLLKCDVPRKTADSESLIPMLFERVDLGGRGFTNYAFRPIAAVFTVDSAPRYGDPLEQLQYQLQRLYTVRDRFDRSTYSYGIEESELPILIMCYNQDLPQKNRIEMQQILEELQKTVEKMNRFHHTNYKVISCQLNNEDDLKQGIEWLTSQIPESCVGHLAQPKSKVVSPTPTPGI